MDRRERKKEAQKQNIVDCAVKQFKEKGFNETSIQDILDAADVSKGTLYNYFPDKEGILIPYFQKMFKDYLDNRCVQTHLEENLEDFYEFICGVLEEDKALLSLYFSYRMKRQLTVFVDGSSNRSGLENVLYQLIDEAKDNGEISQQLGSEFLARSLSLMTFNLLITAIHLDDLSELKGIYDHVIHLFLHGAQEGVKTNDQ